MPRPCRARAVGVLPHEVAQAFKPTPLEQMRRDDVTRSPGQAWAWVGRGPDVPQSVDRRPVSRPGRYGPAEQELVERARTGVRVATHQVAVLLLQVGWAESSTSDYRCIEVRHVLAELRHHPVGVRVGELGCPRAVTDV